MSIALLHARLEEHHRAAANEAEELPPDLVALIANVRRAASNLVCAEADYVYQLAALARAATGRRIRAERSAMEACATTVGLARRTLSAFALIATRWAPDELRALLAQRTPSGQGLSVSQLVLIAPLSRTAREHLTKRAVSEHLDVRGLRALVRKHRAVDVAS